jgi:hypothetical protein
MHQFSWCSDTSQEGKQEGVDLETPPNSKIFDPTFVDNSDINSLAKRRLALNKTASTPQVNVSFTGLAEILQLQKPAVPAVNIPAPPTQIRLFHPGPRMTLKDFCSTYQLSAAIEVKLDSIGMTGPHALRYLTKDDLRNEGKLLVGEVAELKDAERRWLTRGDGNGN